MSKKILAMVFPYGIFNKCLKFYDDFLRDYLFKVQDEARIILVVKSLQAKQLAVDKYPGNNFEVVIIPEAVDIWIRDWAPIPVNYSNGKTIYLQPDFTTGYYNGCYKSYIPKLKTACEKLTEYLGIRTRILPLKTDGGNFAFNGKDTVILTNRIIANNESLSIEEIKNVYKRSLNISNVIFIPVEPDDTTGHTDGMLRFIDESTLVIGQYPRKFTNEHDFMDRVTENLKKQLPGDHKIIRIDNDIINDEGVNTNVASASGNHINFLKTGKKIFLPMFGLKTDDTAFETLSKELSGFEIIKVKTKDIKQISKDGGVLNCVTWG